MHDYRAWYTNIIGSFDRDRDPICFPTTQLSIPFPFRFLYPVPRSIGIFKLFEISRFLTIKRRCVSAVRLDLLTYENRLICNFLFLTWPHSLAPSTPCTCCDSGNLTPRVAAEPPELMSVCEHASISPMYHFRRVRRGGCFFFYGRARWDLISIKTKSLCTQRTASGFRSRCPGGRAAKANGTVKQWSAKKKITKNTNKN